jgi:hypothetical protein
MARQIFCTTEQVWGLFYIFDVLRSKTTTIEFVYNSFRFKIQRIYLFFIQSMQIFTGMDHILV